MAHRHTTWELRRDSNFGGITTGKNGFQRNFVQGK